MRPGMTSARVATLPMQFGTEAGEWRAMSDMSGGGGWWMASDGAWYPPELHPSARRPGPETAPFDPSALPAFGTMRSTGTPTAPGTISPLPVPGGGGAFDALDTFTIGPSHNPGRSPSHNPGQNPRQGQNQVRSSRRRSPRPLMAVGAVVAVAVVALCLVVVTSSGSGASGAWTDSSLHVVGSPVVAGRMVLVVDVTSRHQLELSAVDPASGSIAWRRPYSASEITPGVAFGPTVLGNTVLALTPEGGTDDPGVLVKGLDVSTGRVLWSVPQPLVLSDAPAVCAGGQSFCLATYISDTATGLAILDPTSGAVVGAVNGPERNMAVAQPGSITEGDLWQTDASVPTLVQTSATGQQAWTKSVASLFGGSQYDPDNGWDFLVEGSLDIGSVAPQANASVLPLDRFKTVGISGSDGTVKWSVPGAFYCGGGLQFLASDVVCQFSGVARESASSVTMSGVGLTLRGLDPSSGTTTWSRQVLDPKSLTLGTNVAFADATHLVVRLASGTRVVLDVRTGAVEPVSANEVFWCEQSPTYSVQVPQGAAVGGKRQGAPVFTSCSATGASVQGRPAADPSTVGVRAGGFFVWPTPHGLQAARLPT